eukprot:GHVU01067018.1.p2 GENE.GHVU01067018.1~~GHVU01067018.1.p2  ORF type:complete len:100 (-),score=6.73 GHVU01067018.1:83-382(-)
MHRATNIQGTERVSGPTSKQPEHPIYSGVAVWDGKPRFHHPACCSSCLCSSTGEEREGMCGGRGASKRQPAAASLPPTHTHSKAGTSQVRVNVVSVTAG